MVYRENRETAVVTDLVFRLMFEVFWIAPLDSRRQNTILQEFMRSGRLLVSLLSMENSVNRTDAHREELRRAVAALEQCVGQVVESKLFPAVQGVEALRILQQIKQETGVCESSGAPEK